MKATMRSAAVAAMMVCLPGLALAQEPGEIKTFGSGSYQLTFDSSDREGNKEGHGVHFSLGHFLTRNLALEAAADYSWFSGDASGDRKGEGRAFKLGGLFAFDRGGQFEPYAGLGIGMANNKLKDPSDTRRRFMAEATIGVFAPMSDWWGLRGEFAYRFTDGMPAQIPGTAKNSANEAILRIGMLFPLTRVGTEVALPEPRGFADEDGDGVPDHLDECPGTPRGVRVDARGCPLDSDGDGVPDYLDECPGTPPGVQVDEVGCPLTAAVDKKFEDINFAFDRSDLTDFGRSSLNKTAAEIRELIAQDDSVRVALEGHTDSVGTEAYNMRLGERRARVVYNYLVSQGIPAERITATSAGESRPIATNETDQGRLLNRRVEIRAGSSE